MGRGGGPHADNHREILDGGLSISAAAPLDLHAFRKRPGDRRGSFAPSHAVPHTGPARGARPARAVPLGGTKPRAILAVLGAQRQPAGQRGAARAGAVGRGGAAACGQDRAGACLAAAQGARRRDAIETSAAGYRLRVRPRRPRHRALRAAARSGAGRAEGTATPSGPPRRCARRSTSGAARRSRTSSTRRSCRREIARLEDLRLTAHRAADRGRHRMRPRARS